MVCPAGSGDSDRKAVLVGTKLGFPTWRAVGLAVKQQPLPAPFQGFNPSFQGRVTKLVTERTCIELCQRSLGVNDPETDGTSLMLVLFMKREAAALRIGTN
ncbi:hypothetical protein ATANTOWER_030969 [Ataeniobius toweri]|uniref:Uncharacterized protein n=1 Tax=Ataeniobius toweri TaxID=208326 RepID=A0ABU7BVF6_9TELE|nr:hypothetical protein [Ataeniobius toweri]